MGKRGESLGRLARELRLVRPGDRRHLAAWILTFLEMRMPVAGVCVHHQTPLDYLAHSFLEEGEGGGDAVVWACRGGGKTMIGAVATLLDLLFKPGIQVRILGGSFEQSEKMYTYLRSLVQLHFSDQLEMEPTQRRLVLRNGSRVEVLAQSDQSVRGQRVQKLRCDEVELFDPRVWQAAQLTTRSMNEAVRGTVEAFSTMHRPGGLMQEIVLGQGSGKAQSPRKLFAWCVWDVIEKCPPERVCEGCPLWDSCQGRAKGADGFVPIEDVIAMQSRVSKHTWDHEMLCLPPKLENAVFPRFLREVHVRAAEGRKFEPGAGVVVDGRVIRVEKIVCGVDFGFGHFVCLWMAMGREGVSRVVWVFDELVNCRQTVSQNALEMRRREWRPEVVYCDVAGKQMNSQTSLTDDSVLRKAGFLTKSRPMEIVPGIEVIRDLVDPATGPARLWIDPKCQRSIAAMEGYGMSVRGDPVKDGQHDHLIDALRYAVVNHDVPQGKMVRRHY